MKLWCAILALGLSAAVPYAEKVAQIQQGIKQMSSKTDTLKTMKQLASKSFNKILNEAQEQQRKLLYDEGTVDFDDLVDDQWKVVGAVWGCMLATTPLQYQSPYSYSFDDDATLATTFNGGGYTTSSTCLDYYTAGIALGCSGINDDDDDDDRSRTLTTSSYLYSFSYLHSFSYSYSYSYAEEDDFDSADFCESEFWDDFPDTMTECLELDVDFDETDECMLLSMGYATCYLTCISDVLGCDKSICESTDNITVAADDDSAKSATVIPNCTSASCSDGHLVIGWECGSCGGDCTYSFSAADWPDVAVQQAASSTAGQEECEFDGAAFYVCDGDTVSLHECGGRELYTGPTLCDNSCHGVTEDMGCTYDRFVCDGDYFVQESYCGAGMEEDHCDDCLVSLSAENWPILADFSVDCPNKNGFSMVCVDGTLQQRLCTYSYDTDETDDETSQEYITIASVDMICNWKDCTSYSYSYSYESDDDEQSTTVVVVWEFTVEGTTVAEAEANEAVYITVAHEISEVDAADITVSFALATRRRALLADDSVVVTFNFETSARKGLNLKEGVDGADTSQLDDVLQASAAEAGVGEAFASVAATSVGTVTVDNLPPTHMPTQLPPTHTPTHKPTDFPSHVDAHTPTHVPTAADATDAMPTNFPSLVDTHTPTHVPTAAYATDGAPAWRPSKPATALAAVGGAFLGLLAL